MRKAEKRRLGREKQEKQLAATKAHGLRMQKLDQDRREKEFRDALIKREGISTRSSDNKPQSKISKEKQARVAARLNEREETLVDIMLDQVLLDSNPSMGIDLKRDVVLMDIASKHPVDFSGEDLESKMTIDYTKADVELAKSLLQPRSFGSPYADEELERLTEADMQETARMNALYGKGTQL